MKEIILLVLFGTIFLNASSQKSKNVQLNFFPASDKNIQYTGRIDFSIEKYKGRLYCKYRRAFDGHEQVQNSQRIHQYNFTFVKLKERRLHN